MSRLARSVEAEVWTSGARRKLPRRRAGSAADVPGEADRDVGFNDAVLEAKRQQQQRRRCCDIASEWPRADALAVQSVALSGAALPSSTGGRDRVRRSAPRSIRRHARLRRDCQVGAWSCSCQHPRGGNDSSDRLLPEAARNRSGIAARCSSNWALRSRRARWLRRRGSRQHRVACAPTTTRPTAAAAPGGGLPVLRCAGSSGFVGSRPSALSGNCNGARPEIEAIAADGCSGDVKAKPHASGSFEQHEEVPRLIGEDGVAGDVEAEVAGVGSQLSGEDRE